MTSQLAAGDNWLLYDGQCPFCSRYVQRIRLQDAIGPVRLIDARENSPERAMVRAAGLEINQGMVLHFDGQLYHGDECLHRLALLTTPVGIFNWLNARLFSSPRISRLGYPILRTGRNLALRILGREPIRGDASNARQRTRDR
ncbi:MAG: DCC1-like thiol-disulfide oxidoreductase family protein [Xanthobacteraceae bacterium]